jgi:hypothetical protein
VNKSTSREERMQKKPLNIFLKCLYAQIPSEEKAQVAPDFRFFKVGYKHVTIASRDSTNAANPLMIRREAWHAVLPTIDPDQFHQQYLRALEE